jgi:ribonuclease HII
MTKRSKSKILEQNIAEAPSRSGRVIIAGMDEVGRGPLAGPIVACAYIEKERVKDVKIGDSKKLNQAQREEAYVELISNGNYGIGVAEVHEIDKMGLIRANRLAFQRALEALPITPDLVLIDGKDKIDMKTTLNIPFKTIIKGDDSIHAISCASIIAKVTRDRMMDDLAKKYPEYQFQVHKGYRKLLKQYGASEIHRQSFKPVNDLRQMNLLDGQ